MPQRRISALTSSLALVVFIAVSLAGPNTTSQPSQRQPKIGSGAIRGDSAGLGGRPVRITVNLGPTTRPRAESERRNDPIVRLGRWEYTASRNPNPRDSVPWLLHARPIGPDAGSYRPEGSLTPQVQIQSVPIVK